MDSAKVKEYIDILIKNSENINEQAYLILSARGFLMEYQENELSISDNSSAKDFIDLNAFLVKTNQGIIRDGKVQLIKSSLTEYEGLYKETEFISYECVTYNRDWKFFKQHTYSPKIDALTLEPYIARYIKALSAIGISTSISCDGNHTSANTGKQRCIYIGFNSRYDLLWHFSIISLLDLKSEWKWEHNRRRINMLFNDENQIEKYLDVLFDSNKIYDNRIRLRELKKEVTSMMSEHNKRIDALTDDQVADLFKGYLQSVSC